MPWPDMPDRLLRPCFIGKLQLALTWPFYSPQGMVTNTCDWDQDVGQAVKKPGQAVNVEILGQDPYCKGSKSP